MKPYSDEYARTLARRARFKTDCDVALANPPEIEHPTPWTAMMIVWDGPGIQFFDVNNKPCLSEPIRDPEDAATILAAVNALQ